MIDNINYQEENMTILIKEVNKGILEKHHRNLYWK